MKALLCGVALAGLLSVAPASQIAPASALGTVAKPRPDGSGYDTCGCACFIAFGYRWCVCIC